ncbi:MAG: hypothetical protein H6600_10100, partial [Flavobacteriales bacterium]|nr:hypothetical protein [Flavobacteriales bacterium]
NGKYQLTYHYKDHMIDGDFIWYTEKEKIFVKGQLSKNYVDGIWEVNLPIPPMYVDIITANPQVDWGFDPNVIKDGILSYKVEVEQYTDPLYCSYLTCVRVLKVIFEQ